MSDQPTVYATIERRVNLGRFEHETITIGVSKIPVTAGDELIRMAMATADRCVDLMRGELARMLHERTDDSALDPHDEYVTPTVLAYSEMAQACQECGTVLEDESCPTCEPVEIPRDDEVWTHASAFGVTVELPSAEWMLEPISEVNQSGDGGGQLRALNTALSEAGFKGKDRHWASIAILRRMFPAMARPMLSSLRDLTKYEASILLEILGMASPGQVALIREAASQAKGQLEVAL